jgi:hypothetical protein
VNGKICITMRGERKSEEVRKGMRARKRKREKRVEKNKSLIVV